MVTGDQLLVHLIGDYILQSDWMAQNKTKAWFPAVVHGTVYSLGFLIFRPSLAAILTIYLTHVVIDRFRLARYVVWAKNWMGAKAHWFCEYKCHMKDTWDWNPHRCGSCQMVRNPPFSACKATGYPPDAPPWLAVWLLIIADNVLHIAINALALRYL